MHACVRMPVYVHMSARVYAYWSPVLIVASVIALSIKKHCHVCHIVSHIVTCD